MSLQMYHLLQPTLSWSESHFVGPSNLHITYINNYYRFLLNNFGRFNSQYIIYYQVKRFRLTYMPFCCNCLSFSTITPTAFIATKLVKQFYFSKVDYSVFVIFRVEYRQNDASHIKSPQSEIDTKFVKLSYVFRKLTVALVVSLVIT